MAATTTTTTALQGRDPELTVLREVLSSLRSGTGVVVVIEGSPGIGKSRLLAEAMRLAGRMSARVGLIAAGLTNRETAVRLFVSPHTVNSHLRHAFTKLGINSRLELAHVTAAHAGEPAPDN